MPLKVIIVVGPVVLVALSVLAYFETVQSGDWLGSTIVLVLGILSGIFAGKIAFKK